MDGETGSNNNLMIVGVLAAVAVIGVGAYLYLNPSKTTPSKGGGAGGLSPTLQASSYAVSLQGTLTLSGSGYTPNSTMTINDSINTPSTHNTDTNGSFTTGTFAASTITSTAGNVTFTGTDNTTGSVSSPITINLTSGTTGTPQGDQQLDASVTSVTLNPSSFLSLTPYSPSSVTFTGSSYTSNGRINIVDQTNTVIASVVATSVGTLPSTTVSFSSWPYSITAGTLKITAVDITANQESNAVSLVFTTTGSGSVSTTQSGYVLPTTQWTSTGIYGSNTNPVPFGQWALQTNGIYYVGYSYGPGYYQNASGSAEMYFASTVDALNWLSANGFSTQNNTPQGSVAANPWVNQSSWQGVGYYAWSGSPTYYLTASSQLQAELNYGNPFAANTLGTQIDPYPANANNSLSWQGSGYYTINISIPASGLSAGDQLITTEVQLNAYNTYLQQLTSPSPTGGSGSNTSGSSGSGTYGTVGNPWPANVGYTVPGYYYWPAYGNVSEYCSSATQFNNYNSQITGGGGTTTGTASSSSSWSPNSITTFTGSTTSSGTGNNPYPAWIGYGGGSNGAAGYYYWPSYGNKETYCGSQADFNAASAYITSNY